MEGRIYSSGVFTTVNRSKCGGDVGWLENDPHFWRPPPFLRSRSEGKIACLWAEFILMPKVLY